MEPSYSSKWKDLWNKWSHFDQHYKGDHRHALVDIAVAASIARRDRSLHEFRNNPNVVQPSNAEVDSLFEMGEVFRTLSHDGVYPDVYAAACAFKAGYLFGPNTDDNKRHGIGFRGTRNDKWPLVPSILRDLPRGKAKVEECKRRYKDLALFCEAMRQLLDNIGEDSSESVCMGIAQHYGIRSPLIDLTRTAWVALFFASHGGVKGDVGMVQCFSLLELEDLFEVDEAKFGDLQIVQADFVKRIKNQKGFFLGLPAHRLDNQNIPFTVRFKQHEGALFEDNYLKVNKSHIYPSADNDSFASFADPKLKTYSIFLPTRPTTSEEYFHLAEKVFSASGMVIDDQHKEHVRSACDFHYRLQSVNGLNDVERSFNRLKNAIETIKFAQREKRTLSFDDIVMTYRSHCSSENWPLILRAATRKQRVFSLEFKQKAARLVLDDGLTIRQASTSLGVSESTVRRWVKQVTEKRKAGPER